jgi:thiamine-phosphate pyrophosphorylase
MAGQRTQQWTHQLHRGLYAVTPELPDDALLFARCRAALAGGARVLQYRDKSSTASQRRLRAFFLSSLCREFGVQFIVNDDGELAMDTGAAGVHLGRDDGDVHAARARWPGLLLGVSCYADVARAVAAVAAGADYVAFGSMFASSIKPDAVQAPIEVISEAQRRINASAGRKIPVVAIGGITRANCVLLRDAGADACAVITDLFGDTLTTTREIEQRAHQFQHLLEDTAP